MATFFEQLNDFLESLKWKFLFSQIINPLDLLLIFFLVLGVFYGFRKGMMRMLVLIAEFLVVIWLVMGNYVSFAIGLKNHFYIIPEQSTPGVAFFFIFPVIWASIMIIDSVLRSTVGSWIKTEASSMLNLLIGGILGVVYFLGLYAMVVQGILLLPGEIAKTLSHQSSFSFHFIEALPNDLFKAINDFISFCMTRR